MAKKSYSPMSMAGIMGGSAETSYSNVKMDPKAFLIFVVATIVFIKVVATVLALSG